MNESKGMYIYDSDRKKIATNTLVSNFGSDQK